MSGFASGLCCEIYDAIDMQLLKRRQVVTRQGPSWRLCTAAFTAAQFFNVGTTQQAQSQDLLHTSNTSIPRSMKPLWLLISRSRGSCTLPAAQTKYVSDPRSKAGSIRICAVLCYRVRDMELLGFGLGSAAWLQICKWINRYSELRGLR